VESSKDQVSKTRGGVSIHLFFYSRKKEGRLKRNEKKLVSSTDAKRGGGTVRTSTGVLQRSEYSTGRQDLEAPDRAGTRITLSNAAG